MGAAGSVLAHDGGEFGIEIPVDRVAPGAALAIVGAEWAPNTELEVRLQANGSEPSRIATIRTDSDGHFDTAVPLPDVLPAGSALIQVVSTYGVLDSAVVTIDPAAPRASPALDVSVVAGAADGALDPFPLAALAAAAGGLGLLVVRTRRRPTTR